jgi:hypothetical protein
MAMGSTGMAEHAAHQEHMGSLPPNTLPMITSRRMSARVTFP